jgi:hypothetical protein
MVAGLSRQTATAPRSGAPFARPAVGMAVARGLTPGRIPPLSPHAGYIRYNRLPVGPPGAARIGVRDPYARDERGIASPASGDPYATYAPISLRPAADHRSNSIAQLHQFNSLNFTMLPSVTILRREIPRYFPGLGQGQDRDAGSRYRALKRGAALARPRADAAPTGNRGRWSRGRGPSGRVRHGPTLPGGTDGLWV